MDELCAGGAVDLGYLLAAKVHISRAAGRPGPAAAGGPQQLAGLAVQLQPAGLIAAVDQEAPAVAVIRVAAAQAAPAQPVAEVKSKPWVRQGCCGKCAGRATRPTWLSPVLLAVGDVAGAIRNALDLLGRTAQKYIPGRSRLDPSTPSSLIPAPSTRGDGA